MFNYPYCEVQRRQYEKHGVESVHNSAVSGKKFSEIFYSVISLYDGCRKVSEHADNRQNNCDCENVVPCESVECEEKSVKNNKQNFTYGYRAKNSAYCAFNRFFGTDFGAEFVLSEFSADEIRESVPQAAKNE